MRSLSQQVLGLRQSLAERASAAAALSEPGSAIIAPRAFRATVVPPPPPLAAPGRRTSQTPPRAHSPVGAPVVAREHRVCVARLSAPPPPAAVGMQAASRVVAPAPGPAPAPTPTPAPGPAHPPAPASAPGLAREAVGSPPLGTPAARGSVVLPAPVGPTGPPPLRSPQGPLLRRLPAQMPPGGHAQVCVPPQGSAWSQPVGSQPRASPASSPRGRALEGMAGGMAFCRGRSACGSGPGAGGGHARSPTPGATAALGVQGWPLGA